MAQGRGRVPAREAAHSQRTIIGSPEGKKQRGKSEWPLSFHVTPHLEQPGAFERSRCFGPKGCLKMGVGKNSELLWHHNFLLVANPRGCVKKRIANQWVSSEKSLKIAYKHRVAYGWGLFTNKGGFTHTMVEELYCKYPDQPPPSTL